MDCAKQACLEESNKIRVSKPAIVKVKKLANQIIHNYVYLVIIIPDRKYHQSSE